MHWNDAWHMGGMGLWWFPIIAIVGLIFWLLVRRVRERKGQESPEQRLKRRYATGNIDRESYERILEGLRQ